MYFVIKTLTKGKKHIDNFQKNIYNKPIKIL